MWSTLSWIGSLVDSEGVLWLGLIEVGEGGWKFHFPTCSIIFPYQGILSNKKFSHKKVVPWPQLGAGSPLCGGHHPKVQVFLTPPLIEFKCVWIKGDSPRKSNDKRKRKRNPCWIPGGNTIALDWPRGFSLVSSLAKCDEIVLFKDVEYEW